MTAVAVHPTNGRLAAAFQSGFIRIFEPTIKTKSLGANALVETVEEKIEKASVRYQWTEIGKWKCEMVSWLAWDTFQTNTPLVAAACADGSVKVFDQVGGFCTHNFRGHTAPVTLVKFDREANGRSTSYTLFSASADCTVRVWSLSESKQIALLKNHMSAVTDIDFINPTPSTSTAAPSATTKGKEKAHPSSSSSSSSSTTTPSPNGRMLVTVGRDQIISIYHMTKGFPVYTTIPVYESLESCIVLTPEMGHPLSQDLHDGSANILVAGESGILKVWNSLSAKCVFEQPKSNARAGIDYLLHVPVTRHSKLLGRDGKKLQKKKIASEPGITHMDEDAESASVIAGNEGEVEEEQEVDMIVAVVNDQNLIVHTTSTLEAGDTIVGYNDEIIDAVFVNPNEVAVATNSTELRVFSLPTFSSRTFGLNDATCAQHKESILALAISPCKQYIVTASKDQTLIVWSVLTGRSLAQLTGHTQSVSTVQFFNRTSRYIASGGRDLTWKIWDIQPVIDKGHDRKGIDKVAGSILTVKSHNKDVNCLAVSPNDALLATGSQDKDIKLFSIDKVGSRSIREFGLLRGHRRGVWDVAFSPVDQVLVSCSADMTIKMWNLRDFTCIKTFEGHTASSLKVRFISNGLQLLSSGADGLVKLWNVHDNECVNTFDKHEDKIWALAVDTQSDGARFVTGGGDSMLCLWKDNTESELEAEATQKDEMIQLEQSLSNYVREKNYRKALKLALRLEKPFQALGIIEAAISDPEKADENMRHMIGSLDFELTQQLMTYVRDWNTNAKHSRAAQTTLYSLFHIYRADSMTKFPLMKDLLQALIPYSTRHYKTLDKLMQASYILDYTLQAMNLLPDVESSPPSSFSSTLEEGGHSEPHTSDMVVDESSHNSVAAIVATDGEDIPAPEKQSSKKKRKRTPSTTTASETPDKEEHSEPGPAASTTSSSTVRKSKSKETK